MVGADFLDEIPMLSSISLAVSSSGSDGINDIYLSLGGAFSFEIHHRFESLRACVVVTVAILLVTTVKHMPDLSIAVLLNLGPVSRNIDG